MGDTKVEEIDIKQIFRMVYKNRRILICIVIATILIGMIYSFIIVRPQYQSNSKIIIGSNDASIKEFVKSDLIIQKVAGEIGDNKVDSSFIKKAVNISFEATTKMISISVTSNNKALSNTIAHKYIDVLKTELERGI